MGEDAPRSRVVLVHRYFVPDTPPYASILAAVATRLAADGHDVSVLTCQPSYGLRTHAPSRETIDGYRVIRWSVLDDRTSTVRKLLNAGLFCLRLAFARRVWRDVDVIVAATTPPVVVAAVCSLIARSRGARFVYHKQDVWPEIAGRSTSPWGRAAASVLRGVDVATDRRAWRIVTLSEDMAETVRRRSPDHSLNVTVLNNFDPWLNDEAASDGQDRDASGLCLVYAGNLGRFQGLEYLIQVVRASQNLPGVEWHFFGGGALEGQIADLAASSDAVHSHGYRPPGVVASFVRGRADLGCVSLNEGAIRAAYPSKIMTYLRHGLPVLALVEPDSEMGQMIERDEIGVVARQRDVGRAVEELGLLVADPRRLEGMRRRAQIVYERNFARGRALDAWSALVRSP